MSISLRGGIIVILSILGFIVWFYACIFILDCLILIICYARRIFSGVSSFALGGCVTYTCGGKKYETQEQVLAAQQENRRQLLSEITPLPKPITNKTLTFIFPGYQAIMIAHEKIDQLAGVTRNAVQRGDVEIKAKTAAGNYEFTAEMIRKRNLYKHVTFVESSSYTVSEPEVSDAEDAMYITCSYSSDGKKTACATITYQRNTGSRYLHPTGIVWITESGTKHISKPLKLLPFEDNAGVNFHGLIGDRPRFCAKLEASIMQTRAKNGPDLRNSWFEKSFWPAIC